MNTLQFTKLKWSSFEKELHTLRQLQQKIGWNMIEFEMGAVTSEIEQKRIGFKLR